MFLGLGPAANPGPQQYRGGPQGYPQQGPQQVYNNPQYPSQNQVSSQVSRLIYLTLHHQNESGNTSKNDVFFVS